MRRDLSAIDRNIGQMWSRLIQEAFKHGIDCTIMQGGLLPGREVQGIHEVSKTQNYLLESRLMTRDGRVFYYAKAGAACSSGIGCKFYGILKWDGGTAAVVKTGEKTVMIRNDGVLFTKDELYGGYLLLHHVTNMQNRRILGNDANPEATEQTIAAANTGAAGEGSFEITASVASQFTKGTKITVYDSTGNDGIYTVKADATYDDVDTTTITVEEAVPSAIGDGKLTGVVILTLEEGLSEDFGINNWTEILPNPYADLRGAKLSNEKVSHAGIPGTEAALDEYFWVQTWGPCWIEPGGGSPNGVGVGVNERTVVFVGDGSVNAVTDISPASASEVGYQVAGFIIQNDSAGAGPPLVMLQIRP